MTEQDLVNPHELSRRLEEVLVDAVNDVGVDLNKAVSAVYTAVQCSAVRAMAWMEGEMEGCNACLPPHPPTPPLTQPFLPPPWEYARPPALVR